MIARRPAIFIYTRNADRDILQEICAGIEEEGCLWELSERGEGSLDELAWEAAANSMLGSGVGVTGSRAAMQMRPLPPGENVYEVNHPSFSQCRSLGANSARAVKKIPFKRLY